MDNNRVEESPFAKVHHVGVIVRDMEKAIEHYQSLGIGPFEPLQVTIGDKQLRGKPNDSRTMIRMAQMGGIRLELLQPVQGESLQKEFLESQGEGINHIGFLVDDIDKEIAKLVEKGYEVVFMVKFLGGGGAAYFNTVNVGDVLFELVQWT